MKKKFIADSEIDFIKEFCQKDNFSGMEWCIPDLIERLLAAEEVIKFYATPGNVIGNYEQYREKSEEKGKMVSVGERAQDYFNRCNRVRRSV